MGYELRAGTPEDHEQIYRILSMAFNNDPDDAEREAERLVCEPDPPGGLRAATPTEVVGDLQKVYDQVRVDRTGWSSRDGVWWEHLLTDLPKHRDGGTALRAVLHDGPAGVDGYALWRAKSSWD